MTNSTLFHLSLTVLISPTLHRQSIIGPLLSSLSLFLPLSNSLTLLPPLFFVLFPSTYLSHFIFIPLSPIFFLSLPLIFCNYSFFTVALLLSLSPFYFWNSRGFCSLSLPLSLTLFFSPRCCFVSLSLCHLFISGNLEAQDPVDLEESNVRLKPYLKQLNTLKASLSTQLRELEDSRAFISLGISKEATEAMIKKAYHSKAIKLRKYCFYMLCPLDLFSMSTLYIYNILHSLHFSTISSCNEGNF